MRKLWLVLGAVVIVGVFGAGSAQARLDRSFGQSGVVEVAPPLPESWRWQLPRQLAAARDGSSYALFERQNCVHGNCFSSQNLFRYQSDGAFDQEFGGLDGSYEVPEEGGGIPTLVVDAHGRPALTVTRNGEVVVRRFTSSGSLDPSFGKGGVARFDCGCGYEGVQVIPGRGGSLIVAIPRGRYADVNGESGRVGTVLKLFRLRADGSRDRRYGRGGSLTFGLPGVGSFDSSAVSKSGAVYLVGNECCFSGRSIYAVRVSARGLLDGRFTTAVRHSLQALWRLHSLRETIAAVIARPSGKVDLLGSTGYETGFELRLRANGHLDRGFGRGGLHALPLPVASAALGSDGATVVLSEGSLGTGATIMRILPRGHLDPVFGREEIRSASGDSGLSVAAQAGRRALVLDLGLQFCRSSCSPTPKLIRFLEGPAPRRR